MKRKALILAALFMVTAQVFAQYETNAPIDQKTGFVTYSRIVPVENVSAADLYSRAQSWFATFYASAHDVLQQQDAERALLVGRSFFEIVNNGGRMFYTVTVRCKDGRAKIDISHLQHEQLARFAGQMPDFGTPPSFYVCMCGRVFLFVFIRTETYGRSLCRHRYLLRYRLQVLERYHAFKTF